MSPSSDDIDQAPLPPDPARARDQGLRRSRRLTRWIAVAAVAGAAALGSLYTHLLTGSPASPVPSSPPLQNPAASSAAAPKSNGGEDHGGTARHEDDDSDDEGEDDAGAAPASRPAPQPPAQPPAPTQQPPHTTTGAS